MRTTTAVVVALLVLLGACQQPEVLEPEPSASAAPSTSPAPTMPAQAREDSDEGAVAFVAHWIETFNYAARSGDTESLREMSEDCQACASYAETIEADLRSGDLPKGDLWDFRDALVEPGAERDWQVVARIDAVTTDGPEVFTLGFDLDYSQRFQIARLYVVEEEE